jgi:hypothetical protein
VKLVRRKEGGGRKQRKRAGEQSVESKERELGDKVV